MKFKLQHTNLTLSTKLNPQISLNIVFSFNKQVLSNGKKNIPHTLFNPLTDLSDSGSYSLCYKDTPYLVMSLGDKKSFNFKHHLNALKSAINFISSRSNVTSVNLILEEEIAKLLKQDFSEYVEQTMFHFLNNLYYFDEFKTNKKELKLAELNFVTPTEEKLALSRACSLTQGVFLVKNLANRPSNIATPLHLADEALRMKKLSKRVTINILEKKDIQKLKMNTFLAVAQAATTPPKFIIMEYKGATSSEKPIVLVGKGITFDTGGVSIKPRAFLEDLKYDMTGAATVMGVFLASVNLGLKINLVVLIPTCENMVAGNAIKPGDIVSSMSGKTIEILNTDAEGRLILCDALTYAKKYKPKLVIDVATLTGAIRTALGNIASGLFCNDEELTRLLLDSAKRTDDKLWTMPLFDEYNTLLKSTIADLKNIGSWSGEAGSCVAAAFLANFVDYKWAHLDIAATAQTGGLYDGTNASGGATGRSFYLLMDFLKQQAML